MEPIAWNESMSVGIDEIDTQHMQLVKMLNNLNEAMEAGETKKALGRIISDLMDYAQIHFGTEERFFTRYDFSEKEDHVKEHIDFIGKVFEFKRDFDENRVGLSEDVMIFLSQWLVNHIKGSDMKYKGLFA